jgi:tetratricopeptide (TPR) repeat protein
MNDEQQNISNAASNQGAQGTFNGPVTIIYERARTQSADPQTVEASRRLLERLPTETIPDPAPALPPGSRMPLSRNPLFVGRAADLQNLAAALKGGETVAIGQIAAATGLGGIGKTNLATEFVHRYGQFFAGGVFWLSCADPGSIPAEIAECGGAGALNLPGITSLELPDQVRRVQQEWQSPLPRLLVFDNCEDEALLTQWRPRTGGCCVLVTSRRATWDTALGVQALPIGVLQRDESIALLRKFVTDLSDADADTIAEELGDLPLALHLAGSFLKEFHDDLSPADYLAELRAAALLQHESLHGVDLTHSPTNHALHVGRTFALSYDRLNRDDATDALALALLARAAHFAPGEPIPRDLLLATVDLPDKATQRRATRALKQLVNLGLLENEDAGPVLHRLLAAFVRGIAQDVEAQAAVEQALVQCARQLATGEWPTAQAASIAVNPFLQLIPHLRFVTTEALDQVQSPQRARLCNALGYYLNEAGNKTEALVFYKKALDASNQMNGEDHPETALILNNLASLLRTLKRYDEAEKYYTQALAINEQVFGAEHQNNATILNGMGLLYYYQGRLTDAESYFKKALRLHLRVSGRDTPATAEVFNNLALVYKARGKFRAARCLLTFACDVNKKKHGSEHPKVAKILGNLGSIFYSEKDDDNALKCFINALNIVEKFYGSYHLEVAWYLDVIAKVYNALGENEQARSCAERAGTIRKR